MTGEKTSIWALSLIHICLLISKVGDDGVEKLDGGGRFLEWPSSENPVAIDAGLQALMLQAMKAGNELCKVLGEDALAAECEAVGNRMTKAASKVIKPFLKSGVCLLYTSGCGRAFGGDGNRQLHGAGEGGRIGGRPLGDAPFDQLFPFAGCLSAGR